MKYTDISLRVMMHLALMPNQRLRSLTSSNVTICRAII